MAVMSFQCSCLSNVSVWSARGEPFDSRYSRTSTSRGCRFTSSSSTNCGGSIGWMVMTSVRSYVNGSDGIKNNDTPSIVARNKGIPNFCFTVLLYRVCHVLTERLVQLVLARLLVLLAQLLAQEQVQVLAQVRPQERVQVVPIHHQDLQLPTLCNVSW